MARIVNRNLTKSRKLKTRKASKTKINTYLAGGSAAAATDQPDAGRDINTIIYQISKYIGKYHSAGPKWEHVLNRSFILNQKNAMCAFPYLCNFICIMQRRPIDHTHPRQDTVEILNIYSHYTTDSYILPQIIYYIIRIFNSILVLSDLRQTIIADLQAKIYNNTIPDLVLTRFQIIYLQLNFESVLRVENQEIVSLI